MNVLALVYATRAKGYGRNLWLVRHVIRKQIKHTLLPSLSSIVPKGISVVQVWRIRQPGALVHHHELSHDSDAGVNL